MCGVVVLTLLTLEQVRQDSGSDQHGHGQPGLQWSGDTGQGEEGEHDDDGAVHGQQGVALGAPDFCHFLNKSVDTEVSYSSRESGLRRSRPATSGTMAFGAIDTRRHVVRALACEGYWTVCPGPATATEATHAQQIRKWCQQGMHEYLLTFPICG